MVFSGHSRVSMVVSEMPEYIILSILGSLWYLMDSHSIIAPSWLLIILNYETSTERRPV